MNSRKLQDAIDRLGDAVEGDDPDELADAVQAVSKRVESADEEDADEALEQIAQIARTAPLTSAAGPLLLCGSLIESGADLKRAAGVILVRCREGLSICARRHRVLRKAWDRAEAEAGEPLSEKRMQRIAEKALAGFPEEEEGIDDHLSTFALALLAVLTRSRAARKAARASESLLRDAEEFRHFDDRPEGTLAVLLSVLDDEELLVLHPKSGRGFLVTISGITHNFQLHTLLADALVGDAAEGVPGRRPHPRVVAAARDRPHDDSVPVAEASFHMQDWTAVRSDGTLDDDPMEHVIWHEGTPAEIPTFEGRRVILLSRVQIERTWRAPRDFEEMVGSVKVTARLSREEVARWMKRLAAGPRQGEDVLEAEVIEDD